LSNLRDRLERLGVTRGPPAQLKPRPTRPLGIEKVMSGTLQETILGPCFVTEETWPATSSHGRVPLSQVWEHDGTTVAYLARDPSLAVLDWGTTAFIDVETSGLAGGTGIYAFLVGVGFFSPEENAEQGAFRVRQFFMRDLTEEPALVAALDEFLSRFQSVVTFNGKAFDLPLLATRFITVARRLPLAGLPHLDLLHPARRLWSGRLPSCALSDIEKHVLDFHRPDDVPGWLIPSLYFDYLRTGEAGPLRQVFRHNVWDILSLVALAGHMCALFEDPERASVHDGVDWYRLGRCYQEAGWLERSAAAYRRALEDHVPAPVREQAQRQLSFLYKRHGQWQEAVDLWRQWLDDASEAHPGRRLYPYVELAKYYEHRCQDYTTALELVRQAVQLVNSGQVDERSSVMLAELRHRLARLERKVRGGTQPDPT